MNEVKKQVWFDAEDIIERIYELYCPYCENCDVYSNVIDKEILFCESCDKYFEAKEWDVL